VSNFVREALALLADHEQGNASEDALDLEARRLLLNVINQSSSLHFLQAIVEK